MKWLRIPHRIAAWLALAGMTLNAFWPLVVNAQPQVRDISAEVCSARGHRHHGSAPVKAPNHGAHVSHCTLCTFHVPWSAAIPAAAGELPCLPRAAETRPEYCEARPLEAALDPAAPPRAPPFRS
jgi:hypothetical protein